MKTIFELCSPRADVLKGGIKESDFAADLAQVLSGHAPPEYADPALFFANTHPTAGLRNLLANVCRRLLSIYLRKVKGRPDADQLTPFLTALFKAVESSPGAALVFTLAIGKSGKSTDAYSDENHWVAARLDEAESVAARKATLLDPTAESEVAQVLRRRLFERIDDAGASEIVRGVPQALAQVGILVDDP